MESARVALRPGVDFPLRRDGRRRLAGLAPRRLVRAAPPARPLPRPARAQRPLDSPLLRPAPPDLAFAEIVLLWLAIVATVRAFARVRPAAAWLLAPYLAWVSFASVLNFAIWRLNA
jgi:hypothetical protein